MTRASQWNRGSTQEKSYAPIKKEITDYVYYLGTAKQASEYDYETTTFFIINHIKKEFEFGNDIAVALNKQSYERRKVKI